MNWNKQPQPEIPQINIEEIISTILSKPKALMLTALAVAVAVGVSTTFYQVQPDERAVVTRFGRYVGTGQPGLNFKLPFGIDREYKLSTRVEQQNFGFRSAVGSEASSPFMPAGLGSASRVPSGDPGEEGSMLTGDLKVADVRWSVQYEVVDPRKFLFNVSEPVKIIRDISMATMRQVVGDKSVYEVLTVGREQIASEARELTQRLLDSKYDMGVRIVAVNLQSVSPPAPVAPSFNDVNAAIQDKDQLINTAEADYNKVIPEARGKGEQELLLAQGFATETINRALGDADRLTKMIAEYEKAPEVTKTRLYLDTMEGVLTRMQSLTIVDPDLKGILPLYGSASPVMESPRELAAVQETLEQTTRQGAR
jgi:membrane protease subunit HflK